jgi:hypothetical protein
MSGTRRKYNGNLASNHLKRCTNNPFIETTISAITNKKCIPVIFMYPFLLGNHAINGSIDIQS